MLDDARNGRCYLPAEWLAEAGIPPDGIGSPAHRRRVAGVVQRLLTEADRYYQSAAFRPAVTRLSVRRGPWPPRSASTGTSGGIVRARGARAWDTRAVVSTPRKMLYLGGRRPPGPAGGDLGPVATGGAKVGGPVGDSGSQHRRRGSPVIRRIGQGVLGLLVLVVVALVIFYQVDGQPLPEAGQYLEGAGYTARIEEDGAMVFTPAAANGHGLLIMHGALIKPLSYAQTAAFFARQGYTVFVPTGAARLSIAAVDDAAARLASFDVRDWVLIGHSMGGFAGLELVTQHQPPVRAIALWACAMPGDFSSVSLPMLFIRGDRDGLLPPERFADARSKLPVTVQYVNLPGGNHRGFALYSHQFFDGVATMGPAEQIQFANDETAAFFASILAPQATRGESHAQP